MNTCPICNQEFKPKRKEQVFCSVICRQKNNAKGRAGQKTGLQSKQYKQRLTKDGYLKMYAAKHPYANGRKEMMVHVMVMECHLKRPLSAGGMCSPCEWEQTRQQVGESSIDESCGSFSSSQQAINTDQRKGCRGRYA